MADFSVCVKSAIRSGVGAGERSSSLSCFACSKLFEGFRSTALSFDGLGVGSTTLCLKLRFNGTFVSLPPESGVFLAVDFPTAETFSGVNTFFEVVTGVSLSKSPTVETEKFSSTELLSRYIISLVGDCGPSIEAIEFKSTSVSSSVISLSSSFETGIRTGFSLADNLFTGEFCSSFNFFPVLDDFSPLDFLFGAGSVGTVDFGPVLDDLSPFEFFYSASGFYPLDFVSVLNDFLGLDLSF